MTGQIIHKPIGVSLTKEKLEKCAKNNKEHICVAYSYKDGQSTFWSNSQFDKLEDLVSNKIFDSLLNEGNECILYFNGSYNAKADDLPFYKIHGKRDWFWYANEGIATIFPTSFEGECLYSNFLSNISPSGAYDLWHKLASSHKLAKTIGIKQGAVSRFGLWFEEEGIFYSNQDHKKIPFQQPIHHHNNTHNHNFNHNTSSKEVIALKYPDTFTVDEGFVIGTPGIGFLNYYGLDKENPNNYIDDVVSMKYKNLGFKPIDFIKSIQIDNIIHHSPSHEIIKQCLKSGKALEFAIIRFIDCDKKNRADLTISIPREDINKDINNKNISLLPDQRRFIIRTLNIKIVSMENQVDESEAMELIKNGLGDESAIELLKLSDSHLIERAKELDVNGWEYIHS